MTDQIRTPRGRRVVAASLVALVLLILAGLAGYLAVLIATDRRPPVGDLDAASRQLQGVAWNQPWVLATGIGLAVVGLILLLIAILPAGRRTVELSNIDTNLAASLNKRSLARTARAAALSVDGVTDASATVGRSTITVRAVTPFRQVAGLPAATTDAVDRRVGALNLRSPRTVRTRLITKDA
jgi:hypothetical protein